MKRILVIGCPGSGKSTFSKGLAKILGYPILHLDRVFHIDNNNQITRDELKQEILDFVNTNENFIIDGNYASTLDFRLQYADSVFYFDIDNDICLRNVIKRVEENLPRDDIAPGFDNSILDDEFINYVKNFNENIKPTIDEILSDSHITPVIFNDYLEVENFLKLLTK